MKCLFPFIEGPVSFISSSLWQQKPVNLRLVIICWISEKSIA